eukprot:3997711-Amphidinium_carterae.1
MQNNSELVKQVTKKAQKDRSKRATVVAKQLPALLNLMTFYTAGEKEARAWQCPRVDREGLPKPYTLYGQGGPLKKLCYQHRKDVCILQYLASYLAIYLSVADNPEHGQDSCNL